MRIILQIHVFLALVTQTITKERLTIVGLAPFSGIHQYVGHSIKLAVDIALEDIKSASNVLSEYEVHFKWVNTQCDMAIASKALFDMVHRNSARTFVFGDYCSSVTKPLAESMSFFKLWQISYADGDPTLSDRHAYPSFLRTVPGEMDLNTAVTAFLKQYKWTRVATLFQDASTGFSTYAYTHNGLISLFNENDIELAATESFANDPSSNLDSIIANDGRIIIGFFSHDRAVEVLCKAYFKGMYGYKYVWFLPSSYPQGWWQDTSSTNCTQSQLEDVINGYFTVQITSLRNDLDKLTVSGKDTGEYFKLYKERALENNTYSTYHGYAYDSVWLMTLALNHTLDSSGTILWDQVKSEKFIDILTSIKFSGVTGFVEFVNHSRMGELHIDQYIDGEMVTVGVYDMVKSQININGSLVYWHGEAVPPSDRIYRTDNILKPSLPIRVTLACLAVLGQILAILFLAFNIRCRNARYIKMSSPNMNNIVIVGCILVYTSIYILRIDPSLVSTKLFQCLCITRSWILTIGFSLAFGAMFAKVWRVFNIFHAPHKQKKAIKDEMLYLLVAVLIIIDLVILITWIIVDPIQVKIDKLTPQEKSQTLITPVLYTCQSNRMNIWVSILYAYKGLLLVAGCWFAWQTRHVSIPALNDSKYVGISVYNVVVMCPTAVAISYIIKDEADYSYLIIGLLIIFCTTITLCLVFAPKVIHLRRGADNNERRPRVKLKVSQKSASNHSEMVRNRSCELEAKMSELNQKYEHNHFKLLQLTETLAQISSIGLAKPNNSLRAAFGNLLEIPKIRDDNVTSTSTFETKVTGVTYVDSDVNMQSPDEDESRRLLQLRIQELVESPSFSLCADAKYNDGFSLEVCLWPDESENEACSTAAAAVNKTNDQYPVIILRQPGVDHGVSNYMSLTKKQLEEILDEEESTYV